MRLIVDTNILFSFFWEGSITHKLLFKQDLELFSPQYALEEINKYKKEIMRKSRITDKRFKQLREDLAIAIVFVAEKDYCDQLKEGLALCPDPDDADFMALALKMKLPLWSNDKHLKKQKALNVVSTSDLLNNPEFQDTIYPLE